MYGVIIQSYSNKAQYSNVAIHKIIKLTMYVAIYKQLNHKLNLVGIGIATKTSSLTVAISVFIKQ